MPKTILVVANVYPPNFIGGAELVAHRHALLLRDAGHRVIVFAGQNQLGATRHSLAKDSYEGLEVYRVQLKAIDYGSNYVSFHHAPVEHHFQTLLADCCPDVVHFHNLNGLSTGLISQAARYGAITVLTAHDYWGFCYRNTLLLPDGNLCRDRTACADCQMYIHDGLDRTIPIRLRNDFQALQFGFLNRLICPSAFLAAAYVEAGLVPAAKTVVIHNGADIQRLSGLSRKPANGRARFAFIGHLGPHKGVACLLGAFAELRASIPSAELSIIGDGGQRRELQQMAVDLGIAGSVCFTGKLDNRKIAEIYRDTDVLVSPSVWFENQPVTIMEAMAARTAVVASRIGGIPEFVHDRCSGLLFEPGNAAELALRMREMIDLPEQRQAYVDCAWREVQHETYEHQAARIMKLYDDLAAERPLWTAMSAAPAGKIIACLGPRFAWPCADALDRITRDGSHPDWRFIMNEWLDGVYSPLAAAWVTDATVDPAEVRPFVSTRLPLLLPESHAALRALCAGRPATRFYRTPEEIMSCLEELVP